MTKKEQIIKNYIDGYNEFNVDKMVQDFAVDIVFENINSGEVTMSLSGIAAFVEQANKAKAFFTSRKQLITEIMHIKTGIAIKVAYNAVVAMDLPNGLKKGQELNLNGKSLFEFRRNKIIKLTDIS